MGERMAEKASDIGAARISAKGNGVGAGRQGAYACLSVLAGG